MMNYLPPHYTPSQLIHYIKNGLPSSNKPKRIIIAGAGMSGLVAGSLLKQAGHHVSIIEARNRVGGRIYTIRKPFTNGNYFEAGAMRIPHVHFLVLEYLKKFGIQTNAFINATANDIIYVNGRKLRYSQYKKDPDRLGYPVLPSEKGKTDYELTQMVMGPIIDFINLNPLRNWPIVVSYLERYSLSTFFRHNPGGLTLSDGAIEMIKVLSVVEGLPELSFVEILREYMILFNKELHYYEISGGMDQLPKAFLPQLENNIHFNEEIKKIEQNQNGVTFSNTHTQSGKLSQISGDIAIITIPFTVLQFIDVHPRDSFSHNKWKAIRELHYVPSTKVGLQFNNRFWEYQGIYGGKTVTDLPIRLAHYPSHHFGKRTGVILGSYTWEDDALIWVSKSEEERVKQSLQDLSTIHGKEILSSFEVGKAQSWVLDPYAAGAFTLFKPEQESELFPYLSAPEGKVHFAGEHTTVPHGWTQGAIESGIRVSLEVNHIKKSGSIH
ncbi:flavin monoamine oxidase family protein [Pseudalkalibacillus berkeleyi]|uniref:Flavin monoamine oxidase family protein n=1 Tax=Pseudalkalibacillus berkeleyi TaxID=1069813 RepID=A0ABS9GXA4_9BACL|nr:flavin monoamine oxidase family protein [Pseudalkalibacillus berkeleyi]MCF6137413.1 flavin monoamine oxidase family protein [Pseudalkalibacillus berkeleyi]